MTSTSDRSVTAEHDSRADQRIKDWLRSLKKSLSYNGEWEQSDDEISKLILETCSPAEPDGRDQELFRLQSALTFIREKSIPQGMSPALFAEKVLSGESPRD